MIIITFKPLTLSDSSYPKFDSTIHKKTQGDVDENSEVI